MNEGTTFEAPIKEYHQITLSEYLEAKAEITKRLQNMSEDYIVIGYLLRQIKETEAYKQEGYNSFGDFARLEYGLSESAVSRFMAINAKFSVNGYSRQLLPEYTAYGSSKLSEMLTLSDEDCKLITATTTVAIIREIKQFNKEAEQINEAAVQEEQVEAEIVTLPPIHSDIENVIIEFFRYEKELLNKIYSMSEFEDIVEQINPSGNRSYRHKTYMLFMYGWGDGLILKKMGEENIRYTWPEFIEKIVEVYRATYTDHDTVWQNYYPVEAAELEMRDAKEKNKNDRTNMEIPDKEKSRTSERSSKSGITPERKDAEIKEPEPTQKGNEDASESREEAEEAGKENVQTNPASEENVAVEEETDSVEEVKNPIALKPFDYWVQKELNGKPLATAINEYLSDKGIHLMADEVEHFERYVRELARGYGQYVKNEYIKANYR